MTKTFEETIVVLRKLGLVYDDQPPRLPVSLPQYDDEDACGFSIFRMGVEDLDMSNLDMRRTFFSKSEVANCTFRNTNLEESNLCWNDFLGVDFSAANLKNSDLRASIYEHVNFSQCNLSGADLRRSDFKGCNFDSANLAGAKLTKATAALLSLSKEQIGQINWQGTEGDEPGGG